MAGNPPLSQYPTIQGKMRDSFVEYMQANGMVKGVALQFAPVFAEGVIYAILKNLPEFTLMPHDPDVPNQVTPGLLSGS